MILIRPRLTCCVSQCLQGFQLVEKTDFLENFALSSIQFRNLLGQLFTIDFESTIESVIGRIAGDRKVEIPQENGNYYTPATIRFVPPEKGGIPPHTGSEFLYNPGYDYFKRKADLADSLSYFVMINQSEVGGELVLYDLLLSQAEKRALVL